ncbi:Eukaryotic initiation factor [Quillaja saponaria]|uniref:Eukaryotic initiation factor n=1 Tax=Quillaja saponaria TaxID=32244 RepID=A0AAD7PT28_QUISA|nr:Eukaryotic initiation factor [Quillaja saponaria]
MAATMSPWSKPGAWALDSEEHEDELLHQKEKDNGHVSGQPLADFPSLASAAATKPKKKKGQKVSLAEFSNYGGPKPSKTESLTTEDLMMLPTGPRERTVEELERERSGLGGGFRSFGPRDRNSRYSNGSDDSSNSRWGSSRVSDGTRRTGSFGGDDNRESAPSRADEIDNWAAGKKSTVGNGFDRKEKVGFFDSGSKADESDSWVSNKNFVPSEGRRMGSNGGGFERERKVGFVSSGGADSDNWGKKKVELNGGSDSGSGIGRPRLVLQPRTLPVSNGNPDGPGNVLKPKGANPFGEARPREEVLAEKGQDWKKFDEQLEATKIKETTDKGAEFGKRGFGSSNGRLSMTDEPTERSWRKTESVDSRPQSAEKVDDNEKVENGHDEEN